MVKRYMGLLKGVKMGLMMNRERGMHGEEVCGCCWRRGVNRERGMHGEEVYGFEAW